MYYIVFFFFKQKTAYEMRISDWSSDVCSSDLWVAPKAMPSSCILSCAITARPWMPCAICLNKTSVEHIGLSLDQLPPNSLEVQPAYVFTAYMLAAIAGAFRTDHRSEENTSELQSLMRISYAVFCLKQKKPPTRY